MRQGVHDDEANTGAYATYQLQANVHKVFLVQHVGNGAPLEACGCKDGIPANALLPLFLQHWRHDAPCVSHTAHTTHSSEARVLPFGACQVWALARTALRALKYFDLAVLVSKGDS